MTTCLVGLGSNLGDRQQNLDHAIELLGAEPDVRVVAVSQWHATRPVGGQPDQTEYLNGAALLESALEPEALHARLQRVEESLGRQRGERWAPRTLDLDLLLHADVVVESPQLVVPHPRMSFRRFVIEPAAEIAPDMVHPVVGWSLARLREHLHTALPYVAIAGPLPYPKTFLAEEILRHLPGRFIREPYSLGRETPEVGPGGRVERAFVSHASWALNSELWEEHEILRVSDFWFDECLLFAKAALAGDDLREYEAAWQAGRETVTPPKLLVVLDAPIEDMLDEGVTDDLSVEKPWRRAAQMDEEELMRLAILERANQSGQGPVLRLSAHEISAAVTETIAAIQAMQGT